MHPKAVGDRSQLAVMLGLNAAGYVFFVPLSENTRCDFVIDEGDRLARVQCKTGRLRTGAVRFAVCSSYAHHPSPKLLNRDYVGEVEYFAVYCPETWGVYLVPIEDVLLKRQAALRVLPSRNGQTSQIRPAADYEIARITVEKRVPGRTAGSRPGTSGEPASAPAG